MLNCSPLTPVTITNQAYHSHSKTLLHSSLSLSCFPKMSSALDMSLDDIIGKNKRDGGQSATFRGRRRGSSSGAGPTRRFSNRAPARASPYSTFPPVQVHGQVWQQQLLQQQVLASGGYGAGTGTKLYISNLDYGVSNEDIKVLFSEVGDLKHHSIHYDRSGRSKGTAEVEFLRQSDALAAVKRYNNVQLDGKPMKIELVGVNLVTTAVVPPTSKGILGNPKGVFRSIQERGNTMGRGLQGGSSRGVGRGRGRGRDHGEKKSAEDLDAELEKYHLEAMQIN